MKDTIKDIKNKIAKAKDDWNTEIKINIKSAEEIVNRLEKPCYTSKAVQKAEVNRIINGICKELHEDSEIEITIEAGYAGITLNHKNEKIGAYDTSESLPTMGDVLEYVIGREKHLH